MTKSLKKQFHDEFSFWLSTVEEDLIWEWINKHYISKEKVESLRMEKREEHSVDLYRADDPSYTSGEEYNEAVDELNTKIDELLK